MPHPEQRPGPHFVKQEIIGPMEEDLGFSFLSETRIIAAETLNILYKKHRVALKRAGILLVASAALVAIAEKNGASSADASSRRDSSRQTYLLQTAQHDGFAPVDPLLSQNNLVFDQPLGKCDVTIRTVDTKAWDRFGNTVSNEQYMIESPNPTIFPTIITASFYELTQRSEYQTCFPADQ